MKYELLLKDILKHTQRAGLTEEVPGLKDAMHIMRVVPKQANDMMDVGRLQKFEVSKSVVLRSVQLAVTQPILQFLNRVR